MRGLQQHERTVQEGLAALRAQREATPAGSNGADFQALGPKVTVLAENYPEPTAQPAFLDLQKQLVVTEQRIALARGYYNEIATHYNTRLEIIPDRFLAAATGLKPHSLMAAHRLCELNSRAPWWHGLHMDAAIQQMCCAVQAKARLPAPMPSASILNSGKTPTESRR